MSVEARAHLDAAIAAGEKELAVRAHLLAGVEIVADELKKLRALCAFLDQENERAMERWFAARVASGFSQVCLPALDRAAERWGSARVSPRRDVDDVSLDDWTPSKELL